MSSILITGISGLIGSNLASQLSLKGEKIIGTGRKNLNFKDKNIKYYSVDLNNNNELEKVFINNDISSIVHLASPTDHFSFSEKKEETLKTNIKAIQNIVNLSAKYKVKKIIYTSSGKVYAETKDNDISESNDINPTNNLGEIKKISEDTLRTLTENLDITVIITRIFNVYGPDQKKTFVIPYILSQINNDEILLGNLNDERDYIYVDDVVSAIYLLIKKEFPEKFIIFNIGSSKSSTVNDIIKIIEKKIKKNLVIKTEKSRMRFDEKSKEKSNISKMMNLGWKPKFSLENGLKHCLKNFKNNSE